MKALPLPSPKVLLSLRSNRYYGQLRFPCRPGKISSPYIHPLPPCTAPARASRATPHDFPCVSPLLPRESICRFWQFSLGQTFQPSPPDHRVGNSVPFTRLPIGSLPLQPAGLLGSLSEPLSGNLVFQVTLHTSLQLRGRTAELPRPDSNWQVICSTRHTVRLGILRFDVIHKLRLGKAEKVWGQSFTIPFRGFRFPRRNLPRPQREGGETSAASYWRHGIEKVSIISQDMETRKGKMII